MSDRVGASQRNLTSGRIVVAQSRSAVLARSIAIPPKLLIRDRFDDANGVAISAHTPEIGIAGNVWTQSQSKYTIQNNRVLRASGGGNAFAHIELGEVNQDIQLIANIGDTQIAGIVFNWQDVNNKAQVLLYLGASVRFVTTIGGAGVNEVINGFVPADNTDYLLRVISDGTRVTVWLDGAVLFSDLPPAMPTGTRCGISTFAGTGGANHGFNDFTAYKLGDRP